MGHLRAGMPCVGVARACDALERLWGVRMKRTGGVYNGGTEGWEEAVGCFAGEWLFI